MATSRVLGKDDNFYDTRTFKFVCSSFRRNQARTCLRLREVIRLRVVIRLRGIRLRLRKIIRLRAVIRLRGIRFRLRLRGVIRLRCVSLIYRNLS